jgi:GNAT superfamily N-acetyltransferase
MAAPISADKQSARQLADAFQIISGTLPGAEVQTSGALRMAYVGTPSPFFNYFLLDKYCSTSELRGYLGQIREVTEGREPEWVLVGPAEIFDTEARDALEARELSPLFTVTGMFTDRLAPVAMVPQEELTFSSRWGRPEIADFTRVNMRANEMPEEDGEASVTSYFLLDPRCYPVVAYESGQAVSAALAILLSDCIYMAWMATLPEKQGRGYGEATIREAHRRAREASGHDAVSLHAPEPDRGLLRQLGMRPVAQFEGFGHAL